MSETRRAVPPSAKRSTSRRMCALRTARTVPRHASPHAIGASEFAIHLEQIGDNHAPAVHQKPKQFFARTYLMQNLTALGSLLPLRDGYTAGQPPVALFQLQ
jgi:hypothetical protein